ncbi:hypothetical protein CSOJ01_14615 [Colletotrichum sojae]|uniref:Aromatic prenyltransferase n=1 Tax=Colletotrichum sojae TaxID=2175907 RepID=A0A8H6IPL6_9PEZI|nr:hypothetical protein CSOJ01_14615 [Colletotrichum sojae]
MDLITHTKLSASYSSRKVNSNEPNTLDPTVFSSSRFLNDIEEFCKILDVPFSAPTTRAVLGAYNSHFSNAPVGWRVTSKDSALNYRFFSGKITDVIEVAIQAGFIERSYLSDLAQAWSMLFNGQVQQWCDFDASKGLMKTWLFLGQTRAMEDVLDIDFVPNSIRRHLATFRAHTLTRVRTVAVDWSSGTVNIYWRVPGPLSKSQADGLLDLAGCEPLDDSEVKEIGMLSSAKDGSFAFALTISIESGEIERAAVYATKLPREQLPSIDASLEIFLNYAPDYDPEEWITIGWGFGKGGRRYMKAEKSYCGKFLAKVKAMMTQDPNI